MTGDPVAHTDVVYEWPKGKSAGPILRLDGADHSSNSTETTLTALYNAHSAAKKKQMAMVRPTKRNEGTTKNEGTAEKFRHAPHARRNIWMDGAAVPIGTATGSLGGYSKIFPLKDPSTGATVHLVGMEETVNNADRSVVWPPGNVGKNVFYAGAVYGVRRGDTAADYTTGEVNGYYSKGGQKSA